MICITSDSVCLLKLIFMTYDQNYTNQSIYLHINCQPGTKGINVIGRAAGVYLLHRRPITLALAFVQWDFGSRVTTRANNREIAPSQTSLGAGSRSHGLRDAGHSIKVVQNH